MCRPTDWSPSFVSSLALLLVAGACSRADVERAHAADADNARAVELFTRQCELCHGAAGTGDGAAMFLLFPRPRDFTRASFKLASTDNGIPTDEDLVAVLERGMPGSAMPSFDWMPDEDLEALAGYVRLLAAEGRAAELALTDEGRGKTDGELYELAATELIPGQPLPVPAVPAEPDDTFLEHGAGLFSMHCTSCHGSDGRGKPWVQRRDPDGTKNHARDFTAGILKSGVSDAELAARIQGGIHGTAMPGVELTPNDVAALIAHTRSLIPAGSEDNLVLRRRRIVAERAAASLPDSPTHEAWRLVPADQVALAPLWWDDRAAVSASIAAVHDGERIAIRVRWEDPSAESLESGANFYADAVALQLSADPDPPFFGMGTEHSPTNLWHWKALGTFATHEVAFAALPLPHGFGDWLTDAVFERLPHYQLAADPAWVTSQEATVEAAGMKRLEEQLGLDSRVIARPRWKDGVWEVVFTRTLAAGSEREVDLAPGTRVMINAAIWNGAAQHLRGRKSITVWHELEIAQ